MNKSTLLLILIFTSLSLVAFAAQAGGSNNAVKKLDNKNGKCPCFDRADLAELIENARLEGGYDNVKCTYTFNVDRRLRIFEINNSSNQVFTRAGVACFGPKVRGGNAPGLPGVGSFAMYDTEGRNCRKKIIRAANYYGLECACINQDAVEVECPNSL